MNIKVILDKYAKMPTKAHAADAGFDLYTPGMVVVKARDSAVPGNRNCKRNKNTGRINKKVGRSVFNGIGEFERIS